MQALRLDSLVRNFWDVLTKRFSNCRRRHAQVPAGFDKAFLIMENLATLRSEIVQRLSVMCRSIKVRRLFMFMAEKHGHTWVSDLDISRLDLGKRKRMIVPKGRFDRKYRITVPKDHFLPSNGSS